MSTENQEYDARESGARIEELPASDSQLLAREEREKPLPRRAPEPDDPDDARRGSPPPGDPEEIRSPSPPPPQDPSSSEE